MHVKLLAVLSETAVLRGTELALRAAVDRGAMAFHPVMVDRQGATKVAEDGRLTLIGIGQHFVIKTHVTDFRDTRRDRVEKSQSIVGVVFLRRGRRLVTGTMREI